MKNSKYYRLKRAKANYKSPRPLYMEDVFIPANISLFPTKGDGDETFYFVKSGDKRAHQIEIELKNMGFKSRKEKEMRVEEMIKIIQNPPLPCLSNVKMESVDNEINIFKLFLRGVKNCVPTIKK